MRTQQRALARQCVHVTECVRLRAKTAITVLRGHSSKLENDVLRYSSIDQPVVHCASQSMITTFVRIAVLCCGASCLVIFLETMWRLAARLIAREQVRVAPWLTNKTSKRCSGVREFLHGRTYLFATNTQMCVGAHTHYM